MNQNRRNQLQKIYPKCYQANKQIQNRHFIVKPKPIVEPIKIEKVKLEELELILKSIKTTDSLRNEAIKEYAGGVCMLCAQLPTRLVSYDMDGAQLVERYCEKCFRKWEKTIRAA